MQERSASGRHSALTPRFRKAQGSPKAHEGGAGAKHGNSSSPSSKSYFNSPTLLLRPRTANKEFQRKMSPLARGTSRRTQSATGQDYDQFMQMRFHSFLARKHAASGKQPVQLMHIQPESDLKVSPRDAMTPLVALHRAAAKLDSATAAASPRSPARRLRVKSAQRHGLPNPYAQGQWHAKAKPQVHDEKQQPSINSAKTELTEELLEQSLGSLAEYLDGQENLVDAPGAPHRTVLTYLRRCLYSDRPTSAVTTAEQEAGDISFIPYFQVVATQDKAIKDLKSKYDTRTRKNRDLLERIADLEKERDDLQNKLADQQYVAFLRARM